MRSKIKRILSLFLCFIVLFPISYVQASEVTPRISFAAKVTVCSFSGSSSSGSSDLGHSFLIVTNTTSSTLNIGKMSVKPEETVTFGNYGNRSRHLGTWYNIESYNYSEYANMSNLLYTLTVSITGSELGIMNNVINSNDKYSATSYTCADFAADVWNSISNYKIDSGSLGLPSTLSDSIKKHNFYRTDFFVPKNYIETIGYYNGTKIIYDINGSSPH